ncbi:hypothetical protein CSB11_02230 [Candidatus Campbellbacteria bacterium]|nr:MAG: hypothetical protein CSB11_02230 [Candidatus Campbellbacteria bacterium]
MKEKDWQSLNFQEKISYCSDKIGDKTLVQILQMYGISLDFYVDNFRSYNDSLKRPAFERIDFYNKVKDSKCLLFLELDYKTSLEAVIHEEYFQKDAYDLGVIYNYNKSSLRQSILLIGQKADIETPYTKVKGEEMNLQEQKNYCLSKTEGRTYNKIKREFAKKYESQKIPQEWWWQEIYFEEDILCFYFIESAYGKKYKDRVIDSSTYDNINQYVSTDVIKKIKENRAKDLW